MIENAPTFLDEANDPEQLAFDLEWISGFSKPVLLTLGDQSPPTFAPVVKGSQRRFLMRRSSRCRALDTFRTQHIRMPMSRRSSSSRANTRPDKEENMASEPERRGSCLCGAVRFAIKTANKSVGACHCSTCRKWGGGPLFAIECGSDVHFDGTKNISIFSSSDWAERGFCSTCGGQSLSSKERGALRGSGWAVRRRRTMGL